ncbi:thiamine-phosphate diphosphorylase [Nitrosomonas cryotolerans]|uniref:Thiamine-phosphate synthase n=1 Tax=Nitrosomonas cryotolerans ATCC 49181 TaxID=1131553 RepID=A0A1N6J847_9PROT|nr:thiamine phosphate synthase [Nitrosomonas cryotolerans]SFP44547.1 thiamine-phosphate diphosphorylase [Nitrosomonas cryotolerans]SIO40500.1 thiamine-phosphate diphosphorylase [Nitrosomonas cryotolerans ATCC 49181]
MVCPEIGGLYAITPNQIDTEGLLIMTEQALAGGVRLIQYRNKAAGTELLREQAHALAHLCQKYSVPLIINDHLGLAIEVKAAGLHIGQTDISIREARYWLGKRKIIGASCYNCLDLAIRAEVQGFDYVAFGAFYASVTKPEAVPASIDLLHQAKKRLLTPVVAIGGINLINAEILIKNGSNAIAVCSTLFCAQNIQSTAKQFSRLFY